jgi:hypothetical protein
VEDVEGTDGIEVGVVVRAFVGLDCMSDEVGAVEGGWTRIYGVNIRSHGFDSPCLYGRA